MIKNRKERRWAVERGKEKENGTETYGSTKGRRKKANVTIPGLAWFNLT